MKYIAYIALLTIVATAAIGGEAINESADMKANGRLDVSNVAGSVEIIGWSRKKIELTGKIGDDSRLIFEVDEDAAVVEVEYDKDTRRKRYNREDTDLVIHVPESTRVSASTVSADLTVRGMKGQQRLRTVSGELETQVFSEEAVVKTVSGEIDVRGNGSESRLTAASVSGDVDLLDVAGELDAKSVSGDLEINGAGFDRLRMETVSGDMNFSGKLQTGGRIDADSVSGDIQLDLVSLYNTEFFLESFSGDISPIFDQKAVRTSKYAPGSKLKVVEGNGDSRIQAETMSGDIEIYGSEKLKREPKVRQTSDVRDRSDTGFDKSIAEMVDMIEMFEMAGDVDRPSHNLHDTDQWHTDDHSIELED